MERRTVMVSISSLIIGVFSGWGLFMSRDESDIKTNFKKFPHKPKSSADSNPNISVEDNKITVTGVTWSGGSCEKATITNIEYRNRNLSVAIECVDKEFSLLNTCQPYMDEIRYKAIIKYVNRNPKRITIIERCGGELENRTTKTL